MAAVFRSREMTAGPSPPSMRISSSTAVRCAGWPIGSPPRAMPIYMPCWSRAVASWCSSATSAVPTRSRPHYGRRVENVTFDADTLHDMKSASKSVASLAVGIAIDRGLIRSVNEPIFSFFPELSDLRSPEKDRIQLVHALTMSMGLEWVEATPSHRRRKQRRGAHA